MRGFAIDGAGGGDARDLHFLQPTLIGCLAAFRAHYPFREVATPHLCVRKWGLREVQQHALAHSADEWPLGLSELVPRPWFRCVPVAD